MLLFPQPPVINFFLTNAHRPCHVLAWQGRPRDQIQASTGECCRQASRRAGVSLGTRRHSSVPVLRGPRCPRLAPLLSLTSASVAHALTPTPPAVHSSPTSHHHSISSTSSFSNPPPSPIPFPSKHVGRQHPSHITTCAAHQSEHTCRSRASKTRGTPAALACLAYLLLGPPAQKTSPQRHSLHVSFRNFINRIVLHMLTSQ